jgi:hypothetical protein
MLPAPHSSRDPSIHVKEREMVKWQGMKKCSRKSDEAAGSGEVCALCAQSFVNGAPEFPEPC